MGNHLCLYLWPKFPVTGYIFFHGKSGMKLAGMAYCGFLLFIILMLLCARFFLISR